MDANFVELFSCALLEGLFYVAIAVLHSKIYIYFYRFKIVL